MVTISKGLTYGLINNNNEWTWHQETLKGHKHKKNQRTLLALISQLNENLKTHWGTNHIYTVY